MKRSALLVGGVVAMQLFGCTVGESENVSSGDDVPTWEEFQASVYQDVEGVYIVNGDTPVENLKKLEEFYNQLYRSDGALIVHRSGGADAKWNDQQKLNITYCVSNSFGSNKAATVSAMASATAAWKAAANVQFVYVSAQDASCTASNNNVVFDVRPVSGQGYLARAFFPDQSRSTRNVLIDSSAFGSIPPWTLAGILRHELGHTLGFRHEHTRPEAGTCFEDSNWRALTTYDSASVMHYPQCNGSQQGDLVLTAKDKQGAVSLYGAPGGGNPNPDPGNPTTENFSGSAPLNQFVQLKAAGFNVRAGSTFKAVLSGGTGDPDLYVRFGSAPTTSTYNCRPYLDGPGETCELTVPAGTTKAYVSIRGYTAATYQASVTYQAP